MFRSSQAAMAEEEVSLNTHPNLIKTKILLHPLLSTKDSFHLHWQVEELEKKLMRIIGMLWSVEELVCDNSRKKKGISFGKQFVNLRLQKERINKN